ncbi:MAG: lytic transglycosylase domain-containing protein [Saprospiraceae bacterium]|nr:lytic transglycosylase domain-containing protein [Saprospiraceae bacterium]MCB9321549.1 lytic transglycosylase domain-containing protein [Lewinellaceae bacterium]
MHLFKNFAVFLVAGFVVMLFISYTSREEETPQPAAASPAPYENEILPQVIKSIPLDQEYTFAGETVPLDNFDVYERFDREMLVNSYWHSSTVLNIKAANRYFPIMEPILAKEGVPDDFKYLAVIESNLRNETSPAGARGIWQFLKSIGAYYHLEINDEVDERLNVEKSTEAACKYLKDSKQKFGSWTLAAAAYNMGDTRLRKELDMQKTDNYYDLNLNDETSRYVFRILAVKEILKDPQAFGFIIEPQQLYKPLDKYKIIEVKSGISDLGTFAVDNGITYRMLKVYNPWLRTSKLTNKTGKTYEIKIPDAAD